MSIKDNADLLSIGTSIASVEIRYIPTKLFEESITYVHLLFSARYFPMFIA